MSIKLYDLELSGNCYKVRLFLSLLNQDYELIPVDFLGGEHTQSPLCEMNPLCEIARGPNDARLHDKFGYELDHTLAVSKSERILEYIENHLQDKAWLAVDRPTIADIACFPYIALGHEGRVDIGGRQHIKHWIERIKQLSGFISMPELI